MHMAMTADAAARIARKIEVFMDDSLSPSRSAVNPSGALQKTVKKLTYGVRPLFDLLDVYDNGQQDGAP